MENKGGEKAANVDEMTAYWNAMAAENARKHIAICHWQSEEIFDQSGRQNADEILKCRQIHLNGGENVLEIGVGIGRILKPLAELRPQTEFYGVDVSDEMIAQGKDRMKSLPNVHLFKNSGTDLSIFQNDMFDVIYSYIVFQHIPRSFVKSYFYESKRTLKPGGIFRFQMQFIENFGDKEPPDNNYRSIRYYTPDMVRALCAETGFKIVELIESHYMWVSATK